MRLGAIAASAGALWLALACALAGAQQPAAKPAPGAAPVAVVPPTASVPPIAIVPIDTSDPQGAAVVTGALQVSAGRAMITTSGSITSGTRTTQVTLPRRGTLRVCAATTVKLAADTSVPSGGAADSGTNSEADSGANFVPGLLLAMDHGAVEMSFADTPGEAANADVLMTPDFRILVSGPGAAEVKVRLGRGGDTCVDNSGLDSSGQSAPYVVVTSLFDSGLYRVQPGQRVMFQHGSLREVVDEEKESCGCPAAPVATHGNEFPLAQSEGLTPKASPPLALPLKPAAGTAAPPLVYSSTDHEAAPQAAEPATTPAHTAAAPQKPPPTPPTAKPAAKKPGMFRRIGRFFGRVFGAE